MRRSLTVRVDDAVFGWLGGDPGSTIDRAVSVLVGSLVARMVALGDDDLARISSEVSQIEAMVAVAVVAERGRLGALRSATLLRREADAVRRAWELVGRHPAPAEAIRSAVALALAETLDAQAGPRCPFCEGTGVVRSHRRALSESPCQCTSRRV